MNPEDISILITYIDFPLSTELCISNFCLYNQLNFTNIVNLLFVCFILLHD